MTKPLRRLLKARVLIAAALILGGAALALALIVPDPNNPSDDPIYDQVTSSTLTFTGSVKRMNDSNVDSVKPQEDTMVVTVKKIESSDPEAFKKFSSLENKDLTVIANAALRAGLAKDVTAVFFVDPLVYEKNIAVTAKAITVSSEKNAKDLSAKVSAAALRKSEGPLRSAVASADLIVTGEVKAVRPLSTNKLVDLKSQAPATESVSDYRERWKEAVVQVRTVEKDTPGGGVPGGGPVIIVIPAMRDCLVTMRERIVVGGTGTWFLHKNQVMPKQAPVLLRAGEFEGRPAQSYTALAPVDIQSDDAETLGRIQRMIKEAKP